MSGSMTVGDVLALRQQRRKEGRCPECRANVSIRGLAGEYWWTCRRCEAIGLGFSSRGEVLSHLDH